MPLDTANRFLVCSPTGNDNVAILRPPLAAQILTPDEAINLAAWLIALVPQGEKLLERTLRAVKNT